jgi:hypothetical protein
MSARIWSRLTAPLCFDNISTGLAKDHRFVNHRGGDVDALMTADLFVLREFLNG